VIVETSMHSGWLSNSYLVGDAEGGTGVLVDAGGPVMPLIDAVERHGLTVSHVLVTHADHDHIAELDTYLGRYDVPVLAHALEADRMPRVDRLLAHGAEIRAGDLAITALETPGHSPGHLAFLVDGTDCFTADVLFDGTVGGTMRDSYDSLRRSVMDVLMKLPPQTRVHPGHTTPTTIGTEWEQNPFIRVWRGLDPEGDAPCTVNGRRATLLLFAPDYDGGHKGLVRWEDGGFDVVPGSRVERE
jgi:glyoxylase-like metal-dependent hydrolase (beta-lactamase superfamily II)